MNKKIICGICGLTLVLAFSGCTLKKTSSENAAGNDNAENVSVSESGTEFEYKEYYEALTDEQTEYYYQLLDEYNSKWGDGKVDGISDLHYILAYFKAADKTSQVISVAYVTEGEDTETENIKEVYPEDYEALKKGISEGTRFAKCIVSGGDYHIYSGDFSVETILNNIEENGSNYYVPVNNSEMYYVNCEHNPGVERGS